MPRKSSVPKPKAAVRTRTGTRRTYDDAFKAKVVLEALKETMPLSQLASKYEVHPNQISQWKATVLEQMPGLFSHKTADRQALERERHKNEALTHQIGEQAIDIDFLKKNLKKLNLL